MQSESVKTASARKAVRHRKAISDKDIEIAELTAKLKQADNERAFAVDKANSEKNAELSEKGEPYKTA